MYSFNKSQKSAYHFVKLITENIHREKNIERAFYLAEWCARFLVENTCGIYRLDELENNLAERFSKRNMTPKNSKKEIHLASEIYNTGGHTRLLQELVRCSKKSCDVLLTREQINKPDAKIIQIDNGEILVIKSETTYEIVFEIYYIASQYDVIFVHIHPDDIICAVALNLIRRDFKDKKIVFINHSDHTFSVGLASASVVYEISSYGWALRQKRGCSEYSSFIGIPITSKTDEAKETNNNYLIMTAGSSYKFKPTKDLSLPIILEKILIAIPHATFLVVGPKFFNYWWWSLRLKFPKRVSIKSAIPYKDYVNQLSKSTVYLDSLPMTGGTAFTEALIQGKSVTSVLGPISGYGMADLLRVTSVDALICSINSLFQNETTAIKQQEQIRLLAINFHATKSVRERLEQTISQGKMHPPPIGLKPTPLPLWFEHVWNEDGKTIAAGFRNNNQVRMIFWTISKLFIKSHGVIHSPLIMLTLKALKIKIINWATKNIN